MTARQIALALAAAFPFAALTACDSQSESERLSSSEPYTEQQPMSDRAQTGSDQQPPMMLAKLDKDQDGMVSRSEATDSREIDERFAELDKDQDGQLSRLELDEANAVPR